MSSIKELQEQVVAFSDARDWAQFHSPRNLAMALQVEAAELLELYLWAKDDGPQPPHPGREQAVADEAADVFMCLLNFCERAGVDLEAALQSKLARAAEKYPADRVRGKSRKYHEYDEWEP